MTTNKPLDLAAKLKQYITAADEVMAFADGIGDSFGPGGDELRDELLALIDQLEAANEENETMWNLVKDILGEEEIKRLTRRLS